MFWHLGTNASMHVLILAERIDAISSECQPWGGVRPHSPSPRRRPQGTPSPKPPPYSKKCIVQRGATAFSLSYALRSSRMARARSRTPPPASAAKCGVSAS